MQKCDSTIIAIMYAVSVLCKLTYERSNVSGDISMTRFEKKNHIDRIWI